MSELLNELMKTAATLRYDDEGHPIMSMYDPESIPYINQYERNRRKIKRVGPGLAAASVGVGLAELKDRFPNSAAQKIPNKLTAGLMLGGAGAAAAGGLYDHLKEQKRMKNITKYQTEKTAGLLDGLMKNKGAIGRTLPQRQAAGPLQNALQKAKLDAYKEMALRHQQSLSKKASSSELEKFALLQKIPQAPRPKHSLFSKATLYQANRAPLKPLSDNLYTDRLKEIGAGDALNNVKQKTKSLLSSPAPSTPLAPTINPDAMKGAEQAAQNSFKGIGRNSKLKAAGIGLAAAGTAAYLYNQQKKRDDMNKHSEIEFEEAEKTAVTKEEKVELRRMVGMAKRKVKKKKPNKTKESMYRMKQVKKHAAIPEAELEKMASLMADQFIAATGLSNINPEEMDFETEILAGYKAFTDEVAE